MQFKKQTIILVLLCMSLSLILAGCGVKPPEAEQIKEDLVGKKIYIYGDSFMGGSTLTISKEQLEKVKIVKRQTNKEEKKDLVFVSVEIKNDYITYYGNLSLEYNLYDDKGWVLDNVVREGERLNIRANEALSEEEILKPLYSTPVSLAGSGNWQVKENEVESVEILERNISLDEMIDTVKLQVVCKNGSEMVKFTDTFVYLYEDKRDGTYEWVYKGVENPKEKYHPKQNVVDDYETALYAGVNESIIKNILFPKGAYEKDLYKIIKVSNKAKEYEYTWGLKDPREIREIKIIKQDTNLEEKKDQVEVEITLERDSVRAKGNLIMNLWYGKRLGALGWHLSDLKASENKPLEIEYLVEPRLTEEKVKKDLIGKKFTYRSGLFIRTSRWIIEPDEIKKCELIGYRPHMEETVIDTDTIAYDVELVLQGSEKIIKGYVSVIYDIKENGECEFVGLEKVENFDIISQEELSTLINNKNVDFQESVNVLREEELEKIKFKELISSSTLKPKDRYNVENLFDNNNKTAWVEGKNGDGIGESVTFKKDNPFLVKKIIINNGYKKSENLYKANNRVKNIKITFSDGSELIKELSNNFSKVDTFELDYEKETKWIKFTILDVYEGTKYEDTCITGIDVYGKNSI